MAVIQPSLSDVLRPELTLASKMHDFIMRTYSDTLTIPDNRVNLLASYTHLAEDLYGSILQLISQGGPYDGGAFALMRPLVEASVMAQWFLFCASEDIVNRTHAGEDVDPGLANMMDVLDKKIGDDVFANLRANITTLHGFTHGGIEQLGRRFDSEGNLRANYGDGEKIELLRSSTAVMRLLSTIFCKAISGDPENDKRSVAISDKYGKLYGTAPSA